MSALVAVSISSLKISIVPVILSIKINNPAIRPHHLWMAYTRLSRLEVLAIWLVGNWGEWSG